MLLLIPNKNYCEESNIKTNKENLINLEDGYYKIHVKLWHAHEDKESMGNKAMVQVAELEVKDSEKYLYIGTEKMDYLNITASLVSIFFKRTMEISIQVKVEIMKWKSQMKMRSDQQYLELN